MVKYCALCAVKKSNEISLHAFPMAEELVQKWKRVCGYVNNDCVKTLFVCSNHFKPDDFIEYTRCSKQEKSTNINVKKLKPNVVPSVNVPHENVSPNLPQPSGIEVKSGEESFLLKRRRFDEEKPSTSVIKTDIIEHDYCVSAPKPEVPSKVATPEVATPRQAKRALSHAQYLQSRLRNKVRKLQKENWRLKKRLSSLQELVELLKKRH